MNSTPESHELPSEIPTQAVKAVIRREDGAILLLQRNPDTRGQNNWDLPGGLIEQGENPTEALLREVREELGVEIKCQKEAGTWRFHRGKDDQWVSVQNYACTLMSDNFVLSDEHVAYAWVSENDYQNYWVKDSSFWNALS